jgi:hypothetical protein
VVCCEAGVVGGKRRRVVRGERLVVRRKRGVVCCEAGVVGGKRGVVCCERLVVRRKRGVVCCEAHGSLLPEDRDDLFSRVDERGSQCDDPLGLLLGRLLGRTVVSR